MATISLIPFSLSLQSLHSPKQFFYYHRHQQLQLCVSYLNSTKKCGFVCFACSIKQTRVRKRVKSNEDLRSEIMELVALTGLPENHVPSMKELSAHGRVDLANIVRRRGYKFIRELLANSNTEDCSNELVSEKYTSMETSASGVCVEDSLTEGHGEEARDLVDGKFSTERPSSIEIYCTATDGSIPLDQEKNNFPKEGIITNFSSPEAEEYGSLCKDDSSLAGVPSMENSFSNLGDSNHSGDFTDKSLKAESVEINTRADIENSSSEASIYANHSLLLDDTSSCSDREFENVLMTEVEDVNDVNKDVSLTYDHYTNQDLNYTQHIDVATESLSAESFQNQKIDDMAENRSGSADGKDWMLGLSSSTSSIEEKTARFFQNGNLNTVDDEENDIPNESCPEGTKASAETTEGGEYIGDSSDRKSDQRDGSAYTDKDSHNETMTRDNQVEITRLRFMLRQKGLELSRLKEQIEKEQLSLSILQRHAETEIQKAQMLISEKDVELQEAEGSLSGLQEVEIEYCGEGNVVEVTGSFNGWQHRVGLELQASKSIGKQKCWSTLLWLYPGKYEIKFIVDSQWTTDPQKDSVTRGHITNNILKVDR